MMMMVPWDFFFIFLENRCRTPVQSTNDSTSNCRNDRMALLTKHWLNYLKGALLRLSVVTRLVAYPFKATAGGENTILLFDWELGVGTSFVFVLDRFIPQLGFISLGFLNCRVQWEEFAPELVFMTL